MIGIRLHHVCLAVLSAVCGLGCSDKIGNVTATEPGDPATASDGGSDAVDEDSSAEVDGGNGAEPDGGSFECPSGYLLSGTKCVDVDECAQADVCAAEATCTNSPGSFSCLCASGYSGDGRTCTDTDECATDNGGCGEVGRATCVNNFASAPTCGDIDECADGNNGGCGDPAFYKCVNNDRVAPTCNDLGACNKNNGGCGDAAFNSCTYDATSKVVCADINECETNNGGCGDPAGMSCQNPLNARSSCMDVDECANENSCPAGQPCVNIRGSFYCECAYPNIFDTTSDTCRQARVLVLDDTGKTDWLKELTDEGFAAVAGGPYYEWNQSPDLSGFDTILWLEGQTGHYGRPLKPGVDQLFANFVAAGGGLIRTEWGLWHAAALKRLGAPPTSPLSAGMMPVVAPANVSKDAGTSWTVTDPASPLARNLPVTFAATGGYTLVNLLPGSQAVATTLDTRVIDSVTVETVVPVLSYTTVHGGVTIHVNDTLLHTNRVRTVIEPEIMQVYFNAVHFSAQRVRP